MILIDTHTHLYAEEFAEDRSQMIQRALDLGVQKFLLPNIDIESIEPMHQLCADYPQQCFPMMGLHPTSVGADYKVVLTEIKSQLSSRKYIAIGEIGIDLYWDKTFAQEQRLALLEQFQWAIEMALPVVIHSRDSHQQIMDIIKEFNHPDLHGVFHCFTGTKAQAEEIIDQGFSLGIGGVLTFKNSSLATEIKNIDLKHLVLETDAPYLSPAPHRGRRNESAYVQLVAQKLAETKAIPVEEVARITSDNAIKLFNLQ
jgi:TatD DNase family protein